jgi:hypothetical protein
MKRFAIIVLCGIFTAAAAGPAGAEGKIYAGMAVFNDEKTYQDIIPSLGTEELPAFVRTGSLGIFQWFEYEALVDISGTAYTKESAEGKTAVIASIRKALNLIRSSAGDTPDEIAQYYLIVLSDFQENVSTSSKDLDALCRELDEFKMDGKSLHRIMILFDPPLQEGNTGEKRRARARMEKLAGDEGLFFDHKELYQAQSRGYKILRDIVENAMQRGENFCVYYLFDRSDSTRDGGALMRGAVKQTVASIITRRIPDFEGDLIAVKGGETMIGDDSDPNARPRHPVAVPDFWVTPRAITNYQYWFVMHQIKPGIEEPDSQSRNEALADISYFEAVEFCNILSDQTGRPRYYNIRKDPRGNILEVTENPEAVAGIRLPSEYEWEYAARQVGQDSRFIFGEVLEWTQSPFYTYDTAPSNRGPTAYKVQKGWGADYRGEQKKASARYWNFPTQRSFDLGFRYCVSSIEK